MLEERHVYNRNGYKLNMDDSRRLMWWNTMVGGMGCWFGVMGKDTVFTDAEDYPNPEQLKTHGEFWKNRFLLNMQVDNRLSYGYGLKTPNNAQVVLYKENTNSIQLNVNLVGKKCIVVDTKTAYSEKTCNINDNEIKFPHQSDWAVAIGNM